MIFVSLNVKTKWLNKFEHNHIYFVLYLRHCYGICVGVRWLWSVTPSALSLLVLCHQVVFVQLYFFPFFLCSSWVLKTNNLLKLICIRKYELRIKFRNCCFHCYKKKTAFFRGWLQENHDQSVRLRTIGFQVFPGWNVRRIPTVYDVVPATLRWSLKNRRSLDTRYLKGITYKWV